MSVFFAKVWDGQPFELFSPLHLAALAVIFLLNLSLPFWKNADRKYHRTFQIGVAVLLLVNEITLHIWYIYAGLWSVKTMVPLHLCAVLVYLSAYLMITDDKRLYFISYFLGIAGAIQALITPDILPYGFPHFRFFCTFISHGLIVTTGVYTAVVRGFRPELRDVWRIFLGLNIYAVPVLIFNFITGANYMYINGKPDIPTLLDSLPAWPWYLLVLEGMAMVLVLLLYAPFGIQAQREARSTSAA